MSRLVLLAVVLLATLTLGCDRIAELRARNAPASEKPEGSPVVLSNGTPVPIYRISSEASPVATPATAVATPAATKVRFKVNVTLNEDSVKTYTAFIDAPVVRIGVGGSPIDPSQPVSLWADLCNSSGCTERFIPERRGVLDGSGADRRELGGSYFFQRTNQADVQQRYTVRIGGSNVKAGVTIY